MHVQRTAHAPYSVRPMHAPPYSVPPMHAWAREDMDMDMCCVRWPLCGDADGPLHVVVVSSPAGRRVPSESVMKVVAPGTPCSSAPTKNRSICVVASGPELNIPCGLGRGRSWDAPRSARLEIVEWTGRWLVPWRHGDEVQAVDEPDRSLRPA